MKHGLCIVSTCAGLLATTACGLERDSAAFQQASASGTATDATSTTPGSTGPDTPGGSSSDASSGADSSTSSAQPGTTGSGSTTGLPGDTSTGSGTTGPASVCGNGVVEGDEECDDPGKFPAFSASVTASFS